MDHIGAGKDWDLARRSGGIKILPPYMTAYANQSNALYNSRMEALKSVNYSVSRFTSDYVVLSDCDVICNVDLNDMINDHIENNADITIAVKRVLLNKDAASRNVIIDADPEGRIVDINPYPTNVTGYRDIDLNILVINRDYLQSVVVDAIAHGYTSFNRDVIARNTSRRNFRIYKYDGYFANIGSLADYYSHSMGASRHAGEPRRDLRHKDPPDLHEGPQLRPDEIRRVLCREEFACGGRLHNRRHGRELDNIQRSQDKPRRDGS